MQRIQLIHNPGAGDKELSKESLIDLVEKAGYKCRYASTKKDNWKKFDTSDVDAVIVAGGDGTVRKVCKEILDRKHRDRQVPLLLLPLGTANNLVKTLQLEMEPKQLINSLKEASKKEFGIGKLTNVADETFFMESFGYGVFPYLMMEMKKRKESGAGEKITAALKLLHDLVVSYPPRHCRLQVDGKDHSGNYIMVEIMNIKSIGPNLVISPNADPSDGVFEVVMVSAEEKENFANYLERTMNQESITFEFIKFAGKNITISWEGSHVHVDDNLIKLKENTEVTIEVEPAAFRFLVPQVTKEAMAAEV